tara:strand:- start:1109092 stop:1109562 length:471 start_codon:yes stop_codon:yes gene_type:complete
MKTKKNHSAIRIRRDSKSSTTRRSSRPTILCIDDDPEIVNAIELVMGGFQVELICRFNGEQGIWSSICEKPDLIITDWLMPHGDGEELVSTLKRNQDTANVPIIVLSCLGGEKLRHRLQSMGVSGFVQKPVRHDRLLSEIRQHITLAPRNRATDND